MPKTSVLEFQPQGDGNEHSAAIRKLSHSAPPAFAALCRIVAGVFFLLAAGAKLALGDEHGAGVTYGLRTFAGVIAGHSIIPIAATYAVATSVVVMEVLLGLWLLSHLRARAAAFTAIVLTLLFSTYLVIAYLRVGDAPCGCLGKLTSGKLSGALIRNAGLVAMLLSSLRATRRRATPA